MPEFTKKILITSLIQSALMSIEHARGFLEAAKLSDEWIEKRRVKALILEAHYTTHIEGTHLTLEQSEQLLKGIEVQNVDPDDVKELLNYKLAFDLVSDYVASGEPITESLICDIHEVLVSDVRGNVATPGEYRRQQNYIFNTKTKAVIYTPPMASHVPKMMEELIDWLKCEKEIHPVLVAGIAQFQFVHIHPFLDGNGRTARLLSTLCLYRAGYDFKQLFTISEYYDRDRPAYYRAIQQVRESNMDMTSWLEYFTVGLASQIQEIEFAGHQMMKLTILSLEHGLSKREKMILEYAYEKGDISIESCQALCPKESIRTLQRDLRHLHELSLLTYVKEGMKRRYLAKEL